jgi:diguanylate cyclase (GGDEF)-like protein
MITLLDMPPSRKQIRIAQWVVMLIVVMVVALAPGAAAPRPEIPAFLPAYGTAVVIVELITAYLLYGQFIQHRQLSGAFLFGAYLYSGLIVIPHLLVFPKVFSATGLFGASPQSAVWLWVFWHTGFPLWIAAYAVLDRMQGARILSAVTTARVSWAIIVLVLVCVMAAMAAALWGAEFLPRIIQKNNYHILLTSGVGPVVLVANAISLALLLTFNRGTTLARLWLSVAIIASLADVVLVLLAGARYSQGWYFARINSLFAASLVLAVLLYEVSRLYEQLARQNRILQTQADTDGLTGLANRRAFDAALSRAWKRGQRERQPVSLVIIDVDYFKRYNDRFGHPAGDVCLRRIAAEMPAVTHRADDLACRYGGEEFALILPNTRMEGARAVAELLLERIVTLRIDHPTGGAPYVTASIGVACVQPEPGLAERALLVAADTALYEAKANGRNQVVVAV